VGNSFRRVRPDIAELKDEGGRMKDEDGSIKDE
jgi:hypothetical protein